MLIVALVAVLLFFRMNTLSDIWNYLVEWNLELTQGKVIWLFLVYWGEIITVLIFWDFFVHKVSVGVSLLLDKTSENLLRKEKFRLSILCIRLNYGVGKIMFFLRLGWWRYGYSNDDKIVWNSIKRPPFKDTVLGIVSSLSRLPALIALFLTSFSLEWFGLNDIQDIRGAFRNLEFDFWEIAKKLSPLTVVVLVVFIWYFISFRGSIRRSIAQANRKKMEDIIQKQRDLVEIIGDTLYPIASNLQYVINCQDLVADLWIHSKFPNYENRERILWRDWDIESYCFEHIPKLESISYAFDELNSNGNRNASRAFSSCKYEFLTIIVESKLSNVETLNRTFFTQEGMKMIIDDAKQPVIEYSKEEIEKMREDYLDGVPRRIVDSLKLLYKFCRYYDEMNKLLNFKSDKVGRTLRMFTGKE